MLYLALIIVVQIACVVHCIQKRRNPWWIVGILIFPLIGSAAYVIVEVLPGRELRMAKAAAVKTIDPEREVRIAREALATADTAANRVRLADALGEQGLWPEAALHYLLALEKTPLGDRAIQLKLARATFECGNAAETRRLLDELPLSQSTAENDRAGLLRARALAELGEKEAAIATFRDVGTRMPGGEAQCREAGLLLELGREAEAVVPLAEAERRSRNLDRYEKLRDRDMYAWAERTLADLRARGL
jgi:hypothetical protein